MGKNAQFTFIAFHMVCFIAVLVSPSFNKLDCTHQSSKIIPTLFLKHADLHKQSFDGVALSPDGN